MSEPPTAAAPAAEGAEEEILDEVAARAYVEHRGIPFVPSFLARSDADVRRAVRLLGTPVVLKGSAHWLVHKTDAEMVRVGVGSADEAVAVAGELRRIARRSLDGVLVQPQASGVEMIVGIQRDPLLGPFVMVGMGGVLAELLRDTVVWPARDIDAQRARAMLQRLRGVRLLDGFRRSPAADIDALVELVVMVARLAIDAPEIDQLDLNPVMVGRRGDGTVAVDCRIVLRPPSSATSDGPTRDLRPLLSPRSIAVVGASTDPHKIGSRLLRYIIDHDYAGALYPVHPTATAINGLPAHTSVGSIPERVDLAAIVVSADRALDAAIEAVEAGARSLIVYSAGFAEAGEEGRRQQDELSARCRAAGVLLCGPNSMGIMSPAERVFAAFAGALERLAVPAGSIGFVSQSGAIASSLMSRSLDAGVGFSRWITVGNEADLDMADYLGFLADDTGTRVITVYLEAVRRPGAFATAARRALGRGVPIIAFMSGRSAIARETIASHTGALAGESSRYDAWLKSIGVIRVDTLEALLEGGQALAAVGPVRGRRVGIVTMSGGSAAILADECARLALDVPALSPATRSRLVESLPASAATRNPVDVTAIAMTEPELLLTALDIVLSSGEVDVVILQLTTNADPVAETIALGVVELQRRSPTPLLVSRLGSAGIAPRALAVYAGAATPVFTWPENAARIVHALIAAGDSLRPAQEQEVRG